MADVVALTSIVKSALQLFSPLAKDELLLFWNAQKELKKLEATIETIDCFLQDADKMQSNDLSVKKCLSRLRKVMYDADDLFDGLAYIVLRKRTMSGNAFTKEVRLCFSKSNQMLVLYNSAHGVKSIRESLNDIIKGDMVVCGFIRQQPPPVAQPLMMRANRNKTQSLVHEEDVFGRDQERTHVLKLLLPKDNGETSDNGSLSVVAIIGYGGLGKTTLAQYVYNDEGVKQGFDVCLWTCINDLSNPELVLIEIIASKEGRKPDRGLELLKEDFRRIVGGKKFLLVIDDVWDVDFTTWNGMEPIFRCGGNGSRVLVTTRSTQIAKRLGASKPYLVDLQELSDESAWSLFMQKSKLKGADSNYPELERVGKKIVGRCGNVPLAIVIVGSLLAQREKEERIWSNFLDKELEKAFSNDNDIEKILMLSYNDLLPDLKLCFAYCAIFPKDHVFHKDKLVRLWISQGFIGHDNEQSLEELGEGYFLYLVERCFFQEVKAYEGIREVFDEFGHTAKMHDLIHDIATSVSGKESVFLDKVSLTQGKIPNLRHICIDSNLGDSFDDHLSMASDSKATLRTLMVRFPRYANMISQRPVGMSVTSCRMLRTLCLANFGIEHISDSIGEMIHLRYLDLSGNNKLKHLPESICKLLHLMFLALRGCNHLDKLPEKIGKLTRLRQLYIEGCDMLDCLPPGLKFLSSLVKLDRVLVHHQKGGLGYLEALNNLRETVKIELPKQGWADGIEDAKKAKMLEKDKLGGMDINWEGNYSETRIGKDEARDVMEALEPHQNLEYLRIRSYGGEMIWGWLCTLNNLKELCLSGFDKVEYLEDEIKDSLYFPLLKKLELEGMGNLKGWWREDITENTQRPRLPRVSHVRISGCAKLRGGMPCMVGIESLDLEGVDVKLVKELLLGVNPNGSSLSDIYLISIEGGLIRLPERWIRHLTALRSLVILSCSDLRWVSGRGLAHLTSLKHLNLLAEGGEIGGDEDEGGKMRNKVDAAAVGMPWKALHGLEDLRVKFGNKELQEGLQYLTRLEYLEVGEWTHIEDVEFPLKGLQKLRTLDIGLGGNEVHLSKTGIQYLHSLRTLCISECKELYLGWKTLLLSMKLEVLGLMSVERVVDAETETVTEVVGASGQQSLLELFIDPATAEWVDGIPWTSLSSLQRLTLCGMGEQLPDGIQHLTSLKQLHISECERITSLPNWIPQLTSLIDLRIVRCSEEMGRRCERETGEDWRLISHIPRVNTHPTRERDATPRVEE